MIIPDINLLVYAYNSDAPRHAQAKGWWRDAIGGRQSVGLPWIVSLGFLRLMNNAELARNPIFRRAFQCQVPDWSGERPALCGYGCFLVLHSGCGTVSQQGGPIFPRKFEIRNRFEFRASIFGFFF